MENVIESINLNIFDIFHYQCFFCFFKNTLEFVGKLTEINLHKFTVDINIPIHL